MEHKNAEDYALLAMAQIFSMRFKSIKSHFIAKSIEENLEKAEAIASENLRVWFVKGSKAHFLPKEFGGNEKAEEYLQKALTLENQSTENTYLPTWGREEAHEALLRFYIKNKHWEKAKPQFKKANEAYPKNMIIQRLGSNLRGK